MLLLYFLVICLYLALIQSHTQAPFVCVLCWVQDSSQRHFQYCTQGRKDLVTLEIFLCAHGLHQLHTRIFQFTVLSFDHDGPCNNKLTHVSLKLVSCSCLAWAYSFFNCVSSFIYGLRITLFAHAQNIFCEKASCTCSYAEVCSYEEYRVFFETDSSSDLTY